MLMRERRLRLSYRAKLEGFCFPEQRTSKRAFLLKSLKVRQNDSFVEDELRRRSKRILLMTGRDLFCFV